MLLSDVESEELSWLVLCGLIILILGRRKYALIVHENFGIHGQQILPLTRHGAFAWKKKVFVLFYPRTSRMIHFARPSDQERRRDADDGSVSVFYLSGCIDLR